MHQILAAYDRGYITEHILAILDVQYATQDMSRNMQETPMLQTVNAYSQFTLLQTKVIQDDDDDGY